MKKPLIIALIIGVITVGLFVIFYQPAPQETVSQVLIQDEKVVGEESEILFGKERERPSLNIVGSSCKSDKYPDSPIAAVRSGYFGKGSQVYFHNGVDDILVADADLSSFICLDSSRREKGSLFYAKDKNNVYFGTTIINSADPESFIVLKFVYYAKDARNVYAQGVLLDGADNASFRHIGTYSLSLPPSPSVRHYAKDRNSVYLNGVRLLNSDPETFKVVEGVAGYVKDKNNVYFLDEIIDGADSETFNTLFSNDILGSVAEYAYDKYKYYRSGIPIGNRSSTGLQHFDDRYLLYGNRLIGGAEEILIEDFNSLVYLGSGFFEDSKNVYSVKKSPTGKLEDVPPDQFDIYTHSFYEYFIRKRDQIIIVWPTFGDEEFIIETADADSFVLIQWPYARDKQNVYVRDEKIDGADPLTFELFSDDPKEQYARDKNYVYHGKEKLDNADRDTFRTQLLAGSTSLLFGIDASSVYFKEQRLEGISPTEVRLERGGIIIRDSDTKWYVSGNCDSIWYIPESEVADPENYTPPC